MLKKHPGVYLVFRRNTDTGVPRMFPWMAAFAKFVGDAKLDSVPIEQQLHGSAIDHAIGRFLIGLLMIIQSYVDLFKNLITPGLNEIKNSEASDDQKEALKADLRVKTFEKIGLMFQEPPSENNPVNFKLTFSASNSSTFAQLTFGISGTLNSFFKELKLREDGKLPFLVFLDEADVFYESSFRIDDRIGRVDPIRIIRSALHLLDHTTPLMVMAIGTNIDAMDFAPAVRDNSLRDPKRDKLLPPLILSGNWDIFSHEIDYTKLKFYRDVLLDPAIFNILVSFGRPIWSSFLLKDVMSVAMAKLQNGHVDSLGSRLALLLCRANFTVNTHHDLARNLIKSYMIIVSYVSTDAKEMKIIYSSEPVLAMASRTLLADKVVRQSCFQAVKELLEKQAIDKGRIVESIFEHLTLFAIDDATRVALVSDNNTISTSAEFASFKRLVDCSSHFLEDGEISRNINCKRAQIQYYHLTTVRSYLKTIVNPTYFEDVINIIDHDILDGFINCSHFVQLEHLSKNDFRGILEASEIPFKGVIDKSLLICGILRQSGYVMPPSYYGIDFIVPFVFYKRNNFNEPLYSFIAIQSKTTKENVSACAIKMAANLHLVRCPKHQNICGDDCKAKFYGDEIREICENQICILVSVKNPTKIDRPSTSISLKSKPTIPRSADKLYKHGGTAFKQNTIERRSSSRLREKQSKKPESKDLPHVTYIPVKEHANYENLLLKFNSDEVDPISYPSSLKDFPAYQKPDCIISRQFDKDFEIQTMIWDYEIEEPTPVEIESESESEFELTAKAGPGPASLACKRAKLEKEKEEGRMEEGGEEKVEAATKSKLEVSKKQRTLTCIALNSIGAFSQVVNPNTLETFLNIVDHETSNFTNVDPLHLPVVQNSQLNGKFCPYYFCNPLLRKYRGLKELKNPLDSYETVFTRDALTKSIDRCLLGPVDCKVTMPPETISTEVVMNRAAAFEGNIEPIEMNIFDHKKPGTVPQKSSKVQEGDDDNDDDDDDDDEKAPMQW